MTSYIASFFNDIFGSGDKMLPSNAVPLSNFSSFFDKCIHDIMKLDLVYIIHDLSEFYKLSDSLIPLVPHFSSESSGRRQQAFGEQIQAIIFYCKDGPQFIPDTDYLLEFIKSMKVKLKMLIICHLKCFSWLCQHYK